MINERIDEYIKLLNKIKEGRDIQYFSKRYNRWIDITFSNNVYFSNETKYRIKNDYRPFTMNEFLENKKMFIKNNLDLKSSIFVITEIQKDGVIIIYKGNPILITFEQLLNEYSFYDNSPCGVEIDDRDNR